MRKDAVGRVLVGTAAFGLIIGGGVVEGARALPATTAKAVPHRSRSVSLAARGQPAAKAHAAGTAPPARLAEADLAEFSARFKREIWPLLTRSQSRCTTCHVPHNPSQLTFLKDAVGSFRALLADGRFDPENPTSLLARVTALKPELRMPPTPLPAWPEADVALLRSFQADLFRRLPKHAAPEDEQFPAALLAPYVSPSRPHEARRPPSADNTFLSLYQLRGKIAAIFGDDWQRDGRDRYEENLQLFGGADFHTRYNETTKPSATFLAGMDALSRDVASRAYLTGSGPFQGMGEGLVAPSSLAASSHASRAAIHRLFRALLFRDPTPAELASSCQFLRAINQNQARLAGESHDLNFDLIVQDPAGRTTCQNFTLRCEPDRRGLFEELVDETAPGGEGSVAEKKLHGRFTFRQGDPGQRFELSNEDTHGNVSFYGLKLRGPLPVGDGKHSIPTRLIAATDPSVQLFGAWEQQSRGDVKGYEDGNNNKGQSRIVVPIRVEQSGRYEITLLYAKNSGAAPTGRNGRRRRFSVDNADSVPVEVDSWDRSRLARPALPPAPPHGQAPFFIDETLDNIAFWDLGTAFRFGPGDGVEINDKGTKRRVVADAVKFVPVSAGPEVLIDNDEADGREEWALFDKFSFTPYNLTGPDSISDDNDQKGDLSVLYRPSRHPSEWKPGGMYRVLIGFPGQASNETRVPVIVHAQASSPIVRLSAPSHARVGATVEMDASASYNLQGTPLRFTWRQTGGPRVQLSNPHAARVSFVAPALTARQAAWEGLCRALMKHPDFLFTRPRALATTTDPAERRRLQLVKIAQDLVARTPSPAELKELEAGAPLSKLIDKYLNSQEFRDFYFHRIRLYLESHGSPVDDEPVRLWSYIAFHDRPFQEILTANYTVDEQLRRQPRPAYYGRTGLLTMQGFVQGKPGLPHFNYAAQVAEKFLGYVFEVPPEIVAMRDGITASSTTNPGTVCYSCHKLLTPLAFQRSCWTDSGQYRTHDDTGVRIDDTDRDLVPTYPFRGEGMEAFALQAQKKERFIRTIIQTHFVFLFGREMRCETDERGLYRRLWNEVHADGFQIRGLLRALLTSPEYLDGTGGEGEYPDETARRAEDGGRGRGGTERAGLPALLRNVRAAE